MLVVHASDSRPDVGPDVETVTFEDLPTNGFAALDGHDAVVLCPWPWGPGIGGAEPVATGYLSKLLGELANRRITVFFPVPPNPGAGDAAQLALHQGQLNLIERAFQRSVLVEILDGQFGFEIDRDLPAIAGLLERAGPFMYVSAAPQVESARPAEATGPFDDDAIDAAPTSSEQARIRPLAFRTETTHCCAAALPLGHQSQIVIVPTTVAGPGPEDFAGLQQLAAAVPAWSLKFKPSETDWSKRDVVIEYDRDGKVFINDLQTKLETGKHRKQVETLRQLIKWRKSSKSANSHGYWPGYDPEAPPPDMQKRRMLSQQFSSRVAELREKLTKVGMRGLIQSADQDPAFRGTKDRPTGYRWAPLPGRTTEK